MKASGDYFPHMVGAWDSNACDTVGYTVDSLDDSKDEDKNHILIGGATKSLGLLSLPVKSVLMPCSTVNIGFVQQFDEDNSNTLIKGFQDSAGGATFVVSARYAQASNQFHQHSVRDDAVVQVLVHFSSMESKCLMYLDDSLETIQHTYCLGSDTAHPIGGRNQVQFKDFDSEGAIGNGDSRTYAAFTAFWVAGPTQPVF